MALIIIYWFQKRYKVALYISALPRSMGQMILHHFDLQIDIQIFNEKYGWWTIFWWIENLSKFIFHFRSWSCHNSWKESQIHDRQTWFVLFICFLITLYIFPSMIRSLNELCFSCGIKLQIKLCRRYYSQI